MTYTEQIKHPKWQKKRLEILERDKFTCQNCDSKDDTLHVHHYLYKKDKKIWEYRDCDLITFCEDCHKEWHAYHDLLKEYLRLDLESLKQMVDVFINLHGFSYNKLNKINKILVSIRAIWEMK